MEFLRKRGTKKNEEKTIVRKIRKEEETDKEEQEMGESKRNTFHLSSFS